MKKNISRALSLLLVLVMVLGVLPTALATEATPSITVTADKTEAPVGETVTVRANVPTLEGYTLRGIQWSNGSNGSTTTVSSNTETTMSVTATATFTNTTTGEQTTVDGTATVKFVAEEQEGELTDIRISGASSVVLNYTTNLSLSPVGAAELPAGNVVWTSDSGAQVTASSNSGATIKGLVKGATATITATYTSADGKYNFSATHTLDVTDMVVKMEGASASVINMVVGDTRTLDLKKSPANALATLKFYTNNSNIVAVDENTGRMTAKMAGTTTITAVLKLTATGEVAGWKIVGDAMREFTVNVTGDYSISCSNKSEATGASTILTPILLDTNGNQVSTTFTATASNCVLSNTTGTSFTVSDYGAGVGKVTLRANTVDNKGNYPTKEVYISFYSSGTLNVEVRDGVSSFRFNEKNIAKSATSGTLSNIKNQNLSLVTMEDLIGWSMPISYSNVSSYYFSETGGNGGSLLSPTTGASEWDTYRRVTPLGLKTVGFQQGGTSKGSTITIRAMYDPGVGELLTVGELRLTLGADPASGIEYTTSGTANVTFRTTDFLTYWNSNKSSTSTSSLSYVKFTGSPRYGKLYTTSAKSKIVDTTQLFYYSASGSNLSLGNVTYVPDATRASSSYTVEIPFVAYGTRTSDTVNGTVVIKVNEQDNTIDSRGISLGTMADTIANSYYDATNQQLGFVTFETISAQQGTLYRSVPKVGGYSRITEAERLLATDRFYYDTTNNTTNYKLANVSLIPAARFSGKITLNYTAYNKSGTTSSAQQGTIVYDVKTKTVSTAFTDVKSNYDWAADSVDFLNYIGTAQGSNGKYFPGNNITRGDFMLMLYRAFLESDYSTTAVTSNFPDVIKGTDSYSQEIYQAVGIGKQLGIAQGSNDRFNPKANITREEAMVLIHRTLDKVDRDLRYSVNASANSFSDYSKISSWATSAISSLVRNGVIEGSDNRINPKNNITRAEMACILHRVITY